MSNNVTRFVSRGAIRFSVWGTVDPKGKTVTYRYNNEPRVDEDGKPISDPLETTRPRAEFDLLYAPAY